METTRETNQCDGCRRGMPVEDGIHSATGLTVDGYGYDLIACTAGLYAGQEQQALLPWYFVPADVFKRILGGVRAEAGQHTGWAMRLLGELEEMKPAPSPDSEAAGVAIEALKKIADESRPFNCGWCGRVVGGGAHDHYRDCPVAIARAALLVLGVK